MFPPSEMLTSYTSFYIVNLGFTEVYMFFLFLLYNIDCGYLIRSNIYPSSIF